MADTEEDAYGGVFGTFPYAFRRSESRLFRSYVVVGGVLAVLVSFLFLLSLIDAINETLGTGGGTFTFTRAFVITVALAVVFPLIAPVLLVARHHRRIGADIRYDAMLAATGYLYILTLAVGLIITIPDKMHEAPSGLFAPVVSILYDIEPLFGAIPPLFATLLIFVVHRRLR